MAAVVEATPTRRGRGRPAKNALALSPQQTANPSRTSRLKRALSFAGDEKELSTPKKLRGQATSAVVATVEDAALRAQGEINEAKFSEILEEFSSQFESHAIPQESCKRLAPLLHRWGKARVDQILGLWTFLGDGAMRPVAASTLQVWGPPGTGKTAVVSDYLSVLNIKHIRLNAATFTSLGELNARLIELLRRVTVHAAGSQVSELPAALQRSMPVGQQVRSLDKLEALVRLPLQTLSRTAVAETSGQKGLPPVRAAAEGPVKIVVVIDQAQELPRLGPGAIELLVNLPEVLQWGNQLAIVAIGRLRLSSLGLHPNREPPAVAFHAYTEEEAQDALIKVLTEEFSSVLDGRQPDSAASAKLPPADVCRGVMKFAWQHLGRNLHQLLSVGRQLLREGLPEGEVGGCCGAAFQKHVLRAVQQRLGVCDLSGLLKSDAADAEGGLDTASASALVMLKQMTKAEMRLILAAYLAGYVEKEDDLQLFMPGVRRKFRRKSTAKQQQAEAQPVYTRPARPTSMSRLLAVYHRLARQRQLLGPPLFENLAGLREAGLIRFAAERACLDQDMKVTCRAQLPLVRAIARELNIDLAEYLTKY
jgi:hypothetical protein